MGIEAAGLYGASSSSNVTTKEDNSVLSMNDFFKLLVAELQNQSMLSPVDNAEFIGQMAQFSTLSEMQQLSNLSKTAYTVSLLGKNVTVKSTDESGVTTVASGMVENVTRRDDGPYVEIGGYSYPASDVLIVQGAFSQENLSE